MQQLQLFLVQLGGALNTVGEPVYVIQERLTRVAAAYGVPTARITAFPTSLLVSLGGGEAATLELTTPVTAVQLDRLSALHRLADDAERARMTPAEGLARLEEIREQPPRFGPWVSIAGYVAVTIGIALILHPAPRDVLAAALFGAIVGALRLATRTQPTLQIVLPVLAAFCVSALTALAVKHDLADPGLRAMIAALVVFLPGAALTTSVLELARGDMIAGSPPRLEQRAADAARLRNRCRHRGGRRPHVGGVLQRRCRPWRVGAVARRACLRRGRDRRVLRSAEGVRSDADRPLRGVGGPGCRQLPLRRLRQRARRRVRDDSGGSPRRSHAVAMPANALFLPGFWLLVPGALSLIGLTRLAGNTSAVGSGDFIAVVGSIIAVALGVLCGTLLLDWGRAVTSYGRRSP